MLHDLRMDGVAIVGVVLGGISLLIAGLSWRSSRRSAAAAQRSAEAAEGSLEIQEREAEAAAEVRQREALADVVVLHWEGRNNQAHRGLVVKNNGPAVARDVAAYEMHAANGQVRKWTRPSLSPGQTEGLLDGEMGVSSDESEQIGQPGSLDGPPYARVVWTNADGTPGSAEWRSIQVRH